jgi:hypothetical protein
MILRDIATARAGDKGDMAQIAVFARAPEHYPVICAQLSAQRVAAAFAGIAKGQVVLHEVPGLHALVFLLHGALGGGVSISLASDPHGKSLSSLMLAITIDAPDIETP